MGRYCVSPNMQLADAIQPPGFSFSILLTLILSLGFSLWMFSYLVRRWTLHRRAYELEQWVAQRQLKLAKDPRHQTFPPPFDGDAGSGLSARCIIQSDAVVLLQCEMDIAALERRIYNLCVVPLPAATAAVALRPMTREDTIIARFRLSPAASTSNERFMIHGNDLSTNLRLSESMHAGMLPPDIAILIAGNRLTLDFSNRPFDPIEMDRMISLAQQLAAVEW